jgi:hypothetical protein
MIENQISGVDTGNPVAGQPAATATDLCSIDQSAVFALSRQFNAASSWFFWIAGLSVINSLISVLGGTWRFIFGLGITSVADALFSQSGDVGKTIGFVFTLLLAGLFAIFGLLAKKFLHWVFIVGVVVYVLDGLLLFLGPDYLGLAFHAYVLYHLFRGLTASKKLGELMRRQAPMK